jgi:hypothetical protein
LNQNDFGPKVRVANSQPPLPSAPTEILRQIMETKATHFLDKTPSTTLKDIIRHYKHFKKEQLQELCKGKSGVVSPSV